MAQAADHRRACSRSRSLRSCRSRMNAENPSTPNPVSINSSTSGSGTERGWSCSCATTSHRKLPGPGETGNPLSGSDSGDDACQLEFGCIGSGCRKHYSQHRGVRDIFARRMKARPSAPWTVE
jgi:hypothetical protein